MNAANATPTRPESAWTGDWRRTSRASVSTIAIATATPAAVFVSDPEAV